MDLSVGRHNSDSPRALGALIHEVLVDQTLADLADAGYRDVEEIRTAEEDLQFSLPKELRKDAQGNTDERALGGRNR